MKASEHSANWQNPWVIANWKMNPTTQQAVSTLMNELHQQLAATDALQQCNVVIAPSFVHLLTAQQAIADQHSQIGVAAQNLCCQNAEKGAFTGEVSAAQLKDSDVNYVLVGHSERRQYFHEDHAVLLEKIRCAFAHDLTVIFCIGETEQQYEEQQTQNVLAEQLTVVKQLSAQFDDVASRLVIAYEPVWAIGTGKIPTLQEVETIHHFIKTTLTQIDTALAVTPVLYGGSVKADNAGDIANCPAVNGVLVGGASLEATSFTQIIQAFAKK